MRVYALGPSNERSFREIVARSPPSYFFFTYDLAENPERTTVDLAMEGKRIRAAMLTFDDRIVQLRGARRGVRSLLESLIA